MGQAKTILIVDNDQDLSDGLRKVLERQGFRTIPRRGGYPVLEHFRNKPDAPPIIMITANEGSRHKAYADYLGVIDFIRKPFAMERLLEAVHKAFTPPPDDSEKKEEN